MKRVFRSKWTGVALWAAAFALTAGEIAFASGMELPLSGLIPQWCRISLAALFACGAPVARAMAGKSVGG